MEFDLLVIGGGSGGLAVAKKAASYGATVALVEANHIGGTCVNRGCVPKKMMWYAGEIAEAYRLAQGYGFQYHDVNINFETLVTNRQEHIAKINQVYEKQLQDQHICYIRGSAQFVNAHTIKVNDESYTAHHIVIATGCYPSQPSIKGAEFGIDSDGFFNLRLQPKKVAIHGAGYIAVELAMILNQLGSDVTLLIRHDKPLRQFDTLISDSIMDIMIAQEIKVLPHHQIDEVTKDNHSQLNIHCINQQTINGIDTLIFAIGRTPHTHDLNLKAANVKTDDAGFIITDMWETTNVPHIYAIGDVTGKKLLTPVAIAAGRRLASRVFGHDKNSYLDYKNIPTVVFSHPPIGSVGLSEQEAIKKYGRDQLIIYQTEFNSLFYAMSEYKIPSKMKLITLKPNETIIGCHLIGPKSDEMLQGYAVAIKMGATKKDFDDTVAIHPTNAEELVTIKAGN